MAGFYSARGWTIPPLPWPNFPPPLSLHKMQLEMDIKSTQNLDQVAEKMIELRDDLKFDDATWYNDLTEHLATFDSASTFRPRNNLEDKQVDLAIRHAVDELKKLIRLKIY